MRHCCACRIVKTGGRRKLVCTSTRWAERHPQGVYRIRKAAKPPTAAQQRVVEAEANRIATLNAAPPRAGSCIPEAQRLFKLQTANLNLSLGGSKGGPFSFVKENGPLCRSPATRRETPPALVRESLQIILRKIFQFPRAQRPRCLAQNSACRRRGRSARHSSFS